MSHTSFLCSGTDPKGIRKRSFCRSATRFKLIDGKVVTNKGCEVVETMERKRMILEKFHDEKGHLGRTRTLSMIKSLYYWDKMSIDVRE